MTDEELKQRFLCLDCGVDTGEIDEYYMVRDDVWLAAVESKSSGMLCIGCLEKRLGRTLAHTDFTDAPVNFMGPFSMRLRDRLAHDTGVRSDTKLLAQHWFDIAGTRHACRMEGIMGPLDGFVQFPTKPQDMATVYTPDTAPEQVQISVNLPLAIRRCVEARTSGTPPTFYYS